MTIITLPSMSVAFAALLAIPAGTGKAWAADQADVHQPILAQAAELQWSPGPESLPEGAEMVVLEGDPAQPGPSTLRLRFPADYEIAPHSHPTLERVTVLSGTFNVGTGETFDRDQTTELSAGGFVAMPPGTPHFVWIGEDETVIQVNSDDRLEVTYLDPADDPREGS
jgi:quercetin dioxygenase-like cupin family protein